MSIFSKGNWIDRTVTYPKRRRLTEVEGQTNVYDVDREEGEIIQEGSAFNSENMNSLENRIENAFESLISKINESVNGVVIYDGQTTSTVTLTSSAINYNYIDIYYKNNDSDFSFIRVLNPNGKKFLLSTIRKRNSDKKIWFKTTEYTINGTTISPTTTNMGDISFRVNNGTSLSDIDSGDTNIISICKVIGYKNFGGNN